MFFNPFDQNPGKMQTYFETGIPFQNFYERKIAVGEGMFEHMLKIADRLVIVDNEREFDFLHGVFPG